MIEPDELIRASIARTLIELRSGLALLEAQVRATKFDGTRDTAAAMRHALAGLDEAVDELTARDHDA